MLLVSGTLIPYIHFGFLPYWNCTVLELYCTVYRSYKNIPPHRQKKSTENNVRYLGLDTQLLLGLERGIVPGDVRLALLGRGQLPRPLGHSPLGS